MERRLWGLVESLPAKPSYQHCLVLVPSSVVTSTGHPYNQCPYSGLALHMFCSFLPLTELWVLNTLVFSRMLMYIPSVLMVSLKNRRV